MTCLPSQRDSRLVNELLPPLVRLLLLLPLLQLAAAQVVHVGAGARGHAPTGTVSPELWVEAHGVKGEGGTVAFAVGFPGPSAGVGFSLNRTFGPLGNVIIEGWGALATGDTGLVGEASVGARGLLGPVAMRLTATAFGAPPYYFRPRELTAMERPHLLGASFGLSSHVSWRVNRELIIELSPEWYQSRAGSALRLETTLRLLRLFGSNDARMVIQGYRAPGGDGGSIAGGGGVTLKQRGAPDIDLLLTVGASRNGVWPGVSASLAQVAGGARYSLDAAVEPYRLDVPPLRVAIGAEFPLPTGKDEARGVLATARPELKVEGAVASWLGPDLAGALTPPLWWLGTTLVLPLN